MAEDADDEAWSFAVAGNSNVAAKWAAPSERNSAEFF
jgi:hypothetical protein